MKKQNNIVSKVPSASPQSGSRTMGLCTLKRLSSMYLNTCSRRGIERNQTARRVIKEMVDLWGDRQIDEITQLDIREFVGQLSNVKGLKNSTVNCYLVYLRAMMNFAVEELEMKFVPPKIKVLEETRRTNYLEPDEVARLIRALDPLRADMAEFAFLTGLRNNNVRTLKWRHIKHNFSVIEFSAAEMKNNKPVSMSLTKDVQALLRRRMRDKEDLEFMEGLDPIEYVFFQSNGQPLCQKCVVNRLWRNAVKVAGLPAGTSFHTLRHSYASYHIKAGTQAVELVEMGNWSSLNSVARYTHLNTERKREVANRMQGVLSRR